MATQWEVPRDWVGETCAVLAGGPSMTLDVANAVRGKCRVIAVNNTGIATDKHEALAPWADSLFAADSRWWIEYAPASREFAGEKITLRPTAGTQASVPWAELLELRNAGADVAFDDRPTHLGGGGNSGFHATQLAAKRGCSKILLLGFDMKGAVGRQHYFGEHHWRENMQMPFELFVARFKRSAAEFERRGVRVINCTEHSALQCFPILPLHEALRC